jgi:glyoxylase I family protein
MMDALPPLSIAGLDHLLLLVDDMDAAVRFYQMVAGCAVTSRLPQYAMVELSAGSSGIALVDISALEGAWARPEHAGGRNIDHFALSLSSGEEAAVRAHLASLGVAVVEEQVEGGRLSLYVRDPAANTLELRLPAPATP